MPACSNSRRLSSNMIVAIRTAELSKKEIGCSRWPSALSLKRSEGFYQNPLVINFAYERMPPSVLLSTSAISIPFSRSARS